MSSDKLKARQAQRQREAMAAARENAARARADAGLPPPPTHAGPWSDAERDAAIEEARAAFPREAAIEVAMLMPKERSMNLPGYQSGGEPLKAKPGARRGHVMFFVPMMRHHVVIHFDQDARKIETACSHEANFHRWHPARPAAIAADEPRKRAA
jgi:hypothetical protein